MSEVRKYRKKPVIIEAIQYLREDNIHQVQDFVGESLHYNATEDEYYIKTLEGDMKRSKGDFIIKGVNGEFYPCKPEIFEKTYEEINESKS